MGMLLIASANALSYFFRSENWGSLIGKTNQSGESIGFPFQVWEAGNTYGGFFADYPMIASRFAARPGTGLAIYALGPSSLVLIAMLPHGLSWQQRIGIITPAAVTLIAVAIAAESR